MPRDSQGNFTNQFNWEDDAANGIDIVPDRHQAGDDDQAQGITDSLDRKGRGGMQADLAVGNNKIVQVNEGTAATDALNISQTQTMPFTVGTDTGAANAYVIALNPPITAYTTGLRVRFYAANANTGASTLQVNGVVPAPPLQWAAKDLAADTIKAGVLVEADFDGSAFQIINVPEVLPVAYGGTGGTTALGTAAFENVGTAIGEVVQLVDVGGNAGLPVVDGSQLTGITPSRGMLVLTASGTFTKATDVPSDVTTITVTCISAGGGGGPVPATAGGEGAAGSGGACGGVAVSTLTLASLNATENYAVGTGGASGNNGGDTTFGTTPIVTALGGLAGNAGVATSGFRGTDGGLGQGGTGDFVSNGGTGSPGITSNASGIGGNGADGPFGGGGQGRFSTTLLSGLNGSGYGAGGAGASAGPSQAGTIGGTGSNGVIVITY